MMDSKVFMRFRRAVVLAAFAVALAVSGCSGSDLVFQPTITQQYASARIEQMLRGTAAALSPRPRLELYKPGSFVIGCFANPENLADKRVLVSRDYWLRGITPRDNASIGEQVLRLWKQKGYRIVETLDIGQDSPQITAATKDNLSIALEWSDNGALSIGASSPCLWPDGTPPPGH